jgi:hypothetical protein
MVTIALPVAARDLGKSTVAHDSIVGMASPTPAPEIIQPGSTAPRKSGCARTLLSTIQAPLAHNTQPSAAMAPAGNLRVKR